MCMEASLVTALNTAAAGLYLRVRGRAFTGHRSPVEQIDDAGHYQAIAGSSIDAIQDQTRRKLTIRNRRLTDVESPDAVTVSLRQAAATTKRAHAICVSTAKDTNGCPATPCCPALKSL